MMGDSSGFFGDLDFFRLFGDLSGVRNFLDDVFTIAERVRGRCCSRIGVFECLGFRFSELLLFWLEKGETAAEGSCECRFDIGTSLETSDAMLVRICGYCYSTKYLKPARERCLRVQLTPVHQIYLFILDELI